MHITVRRSGFSALSFLRQLLRGLISMKPRSKSSVYGNSSDFRARSILCPLYPLMPPTQEKNANVLYALLLLAWGISCKCAFSVGQIGGYIGLISVASSARNNEARL
jgi:hypothetical protein